MSRSVAFYQYFAEIKFMLVRAATVSLYRFSLFFRNELN